MREIIVAGAGLGQVTPEVQEAVNDADVILCAERFADIIPPHKKRLDIMSFKDIEHETGKILFLVSGDPGLFSLLPTIKRKFPGANIKVLPGISSLQAICARACETWNDAAILSGHGRTLSAGVFLNTVERNRITILFCDKNISPSWACEKLSRMAVDVFICECLGTPEERVTSGTPQELSGREYSQPAIVLVRNNAPYTPVTIYPRDSEFIRAEGVVMTNEAVRSVILGRLNLKPDCVFLDIGAGTGSISVCAGLAFPFSDIHAVEHKPQAVDVISLNAQKFHLHNINIHASHALDVIGTLPAKPSSVFIGGSGGELPGILEYLSGLGVHVVIACVTLETLNTAYNIMHSWQNFEAVQVSVSSSKLLTPSSTLMKAQAPVMILSAESE